jgi:putative membrane protein
MPGFVIRLAIYALGLWLADAMVSGMQIQGTRTFVAAALLLGVVNAVVRPMAVILTFPFTVLSLGLFLLVINAAMLGLVAALLKDFSLNGFGAAFFGAVVVSLTSWVSSHYIGPRGDVEIMVVEARR